MQLLKSIVCRLTGKHTHDHKRLQREVREDPVLPQSLPSGDSPAWGQGSGYKHRGIRVSAGKREEAKGTEVPSPIQHYLKTKPRSCPSLCLICTLEENHLAEGTLTFTEVSRRITDALRHTKRAKCYLRGPYYSPCQNGHTGDRYVQPQR